MITQKGSKSHIGKFSIQSLIYFFIFLFVVTDNTVTSAQIIWAGLKFGGQVNMLKREAGYSADTVNIKSVAGFNIGAAVAFKVKDRYFLMTEYIYSTKGKVVTGKIDPDLRDKINYHYFEVPILFSMQFKGHLNGGKNFKMYAGAGPNIAYLLGGRGNISSGEQKEYGIKSLSYKIKFGERQDRNHNDNIHYTDVNRLQLGINLGAGVILEPIPKHKVILDVRYTFDQTVFGKRNADYIIPHDYDDNLRFRNRTLRISFMYLLQYNLSKQERHLGKSTEPKSR